MSYHSSSIRASQAPPKKLQIVLVNAMMNNKAYSLEVSYWVTISELKRKIEKNFGIPVAIQRLFFKAQELNQNNFSMISFGGKKKIKIILRPTPKLENSLGLIKQYETLPKTGTMESLLFHIQEGFNLELIPKLTFEGTSGSYFLQNKFRKPIAIFKPFDEEPFTPNNPKGYIGKIGSPAFKPGVRSGESAAREVAAYLLDQVDGKSFTGVPATTFVEIIHPYFSNRDGDEKVITANPSDGTQGYSQYAEGSKKLIIKHGSLQQFVQGAEEASDYGSGSFSDDAVRRIAILDLRILNCDRNEGNILVRKEKTGLELIPIDHGLSFPDCFEACVWDLVWMEWPQVQKKWTPAELDYITKINPKEDIDKLTKHFKFRDICLRNFRIAETVLKKFALSGFNIYEIGNFMYREDPDFTSPLEALIKDTEEFYEMMENNTVKQILNRINEATPKRKSHHGFHFEKCSNEADLTFDPLKEAYGTIRKRAQSIDLENAEASPKKMLQSILEASELEFNQEPELNFELFPIPELDRAMSELTVLKRQVSKPFARQHTFFNPVGSKVLEEESSDDDADFSEEADEVMSHRPLKRSSSIPHLQKRSISKPESSEGSDKSPTLSKRKSKERQQTFYQKDKSVPLHKDESFFKYFESFLDQKVAIMLKNKALPPTRSRFLSEY